MNKYIPLIAGTLIAANAYGANPNTAIPMGSRSQNSSKSNNYGQLHLRGEGIYNHNTEDTTGAGEITGELPINDFLTLGARGRGTEDMFSGEGYIRLSDEDVGKILLGGGYIKHKEVDGFKVRGELGVNIAKPGNTSLDVLVRGVASTGNENISDGRLYGLDKLNGEALVTWGTENLLAGMGYGMRETMDDRLEGVRVLVAGRVNDRLMLDIGYDQGGKEIRMGLSYRFGQGGVGVPRMDIGVTSRELVEDMLRDLGTTREEEIRTDTSVGVQGGGGTGGTVTEPEEEEQEVTGTGGTGRKVAEPQN